MERGPQRRDQVPATAAGGPPTREFAAQLALALPAVARSARSFARQRADADDLVQETLLRAFQARHACKVQGKLDGWLITILRNCLRDRFRRARREVSVGERIEEFAAEPGGQEPARQWDQVSAADADWALAALPEPFRSTYRLFAGDRLSYAQIAEHLGVPRATVGTRLRRARAGLRRLLKNRLGGFGSNALDERDLQRKSGISSGDRVLVP